MEIHPGFCLHPPSFEPRCHWAGTGARAMSGERPDTAPGLDRLLADNVRSVMRAVRSMAIGALRDAMSEVQTAK